MAATRWVGCAAQNFRTGRPAGHTPSAIVLHRTGGSLAELRARFADPRSSLSAHYGVGRDGSVEQYVSELDTAFHAGLVVNSWWTGLKPKVNPNFYTIGIEHEGTGSDWPDAQCAASAELIAAIAERWAINITRDRVVPHSAIRASVNCPGSSCPIDAILELAQNAPASSVAVSTDEMELHASPAAPQSVAPAIDRTTLALPENQYYGQACAKDLIVLHFTAGTTARSAFNTWTSNPEHVATAYIVDADGTIYEVFAPQFWAYHLGVKGGTPHERRSIGIEIANVGPLQQSRDDAAALNWWPNTWGSKYCHLEESHRYVKAKYRDKEYFAAFTDSQMDTVGRLVRYLCDEFGIRKESPQLSERLNCNPMLFASYKGIATHANFRPDKWDIGPAFNWDRLGL